MLLLTYNPNREKIYQLIESEYYEWGINLFLQHGYSIDDLINYLFDKATHSYFNNGVFLKAITISLKVFNKQVNIIYAIEKDITQYKTSENVFLSININDKVILYYNVDYGFVVHKRLSLSDNHLNCPKLTWKMIKLELKALIRNYIDKYRQ